MVDSGTLPHTLAGFCAGLSETLVGCQYVQKKTVKDFFNIFMNTNYPFFAQASDISVWRCSNDAARKECHTLLDSASSQES